MSVEQYKTYFKGKQEFTSVGRVIKTLLPPAYDGVDPAVLEHARIRGERVCIREAFVTQRIEAGGQNERGRKA